MLCPLCRNEMKISRSYIQVEGDQSPDTETKVYTILELACRDKNCPNYEKVVKEERIQVPVSN